MADQVKLLDDGRLIDLQDRTVGNIFDRDPYVTQVLPLTPTRTKWLDMGHAGHGVTTQGAGVGSSNLNDTSTFGAGSQCITVTSKGDGVQCAIRKLGMANVDLTNSCVGIWLKIDNPIDMASIDLELGNASLANFFRFRLQSGHINVADNTRGTSDWLPANQWVFLTLGNGDVTANTGSPVVSTITDFQIDMRDKNAGNPVTYHVGPMVTFPISPTWTNGVVSVVFDDGFQTQFDQARMYMDTYGFPGTAYVICDLIDSTNVAYMTTAELQQMQNLSQWQIAAHSYTIADHDNRFWSLTPAQLEYNFRSMKAWLRDRGLRGYDDMALPGGEIDLNGQVMAVARKYFRSVRTINDVIKEQPSPADPGRLRCHTTINTDSTATIQGLIDKAFTNRQWLILLFHNIVTSPTSSSQYSIANFQTIIDYLNTKGIPVRTVADVLRSVG